jgi:hypothetical protein
MDIVLIWSLILDGSNINYLIIVISSNCQKSISNQFSKIHWFLLLIDLLELIKIFFACVWIIFIQQASQEIIWFKNIVYRLKFVILRNFILLEKIKCLIDLNLSVKFLSDCLGFNLTLASTQYIWDDLIRELICIICQYNFIVIKSKLLKS